MDCIDSHPSDGPYHKQMRNYMRIYTSKSDGRCICNSMTVHNDRTVNTHNGTSAADLQHEHESINMSNALVPHSLRTPPAVTDADMQGITDGQVVHLQERTAHQTIILDKLLDDMVTTSITTDVNSQLTVSYATFVIRKILFISIIF